MEMVYYSEDKKYAFFNGVKYSIADKGYYRATLKENAKNPNISRLHRAVWFCQFGEIAEGFDVHHKDENKSNNNIENLVLVEHGKHSVTHIEGSLGKTWHNKPTQQYVCTLCGEMFQSNHFYGERQNRFCSQYCANKQWSLDNRSKKNTEETKICPHCKKEFVTTIEKQVYCKNMCGQAERTLAYRRRKREALKNNKEN